MNARRCEGSQTIDRGGDTSIYGLTHIRLIAKYPAKYRQKSKRIFIAFASPVPVPSLPSPRRPAEPKRGIGDTASKSELEDSRQHRQATAPNYLHQDLVLASTGFSTTQIRFRAQPAHQIMADLPKARVSVTRPFQRVGFNTPKSIKGSPSTPQRSTPGLNMNSQAKTYRTLGVKYPILIHIKTSPISHIPSFQPL
ncbi:hypothetical protein NQ318_007841 [Aromia moschata]|uniref:Uncharacterized protein n=1 Tax=Aromia moschata TaxID=1265417 RepID=A0AAV8Z195_9CUCU|nr:hypothetical protein NQ318_007841 [Aromia moschata]